MRCLIVAILGVAMTGCGSRTKPASTSVETAGKTELPPMTLGDSAAVPSNNQITEAASQMIKVRLPSPERTLFSAMRVREAPHAFRPRKEDSAWYVDGDFEAPDSPGMSQRHKFTAVVRYVAEGHDRTHGESDDVDAHRPYLSTANGREFQIVWVRVDGRELYVGPRLSRELEKIGH